MQSIVPELSSPRASQSAPPAVRTASSAAPCSNRSLPKARLAPTPRSPAAPSRRTERRTSPPPAACSSIRNTGDSITAASLVRVTHPFHPLSGRQFACVGERYNRYGKRLLLRVDDVTVRSVPPQWTDLVAPDPEIVMGRHRALFRVADLVELAQLVEELGRRRSLNRPEMV